MTASDAKDNKIYYNHKYSWTLGQRLGSGHLLIVNFNNLSKLIVKGPTPLSKVYLLVTEPQSAIPEQSCAV